LNFSLEYPYTLLLLLLIPCFIWCRLKSNILYFSKPEWLPNRVFLWDNNLLLIISISTLLIISLASPYSYDNSTSSKKRGRDLVLALDTSGSMGERGFNKERRELSRYDISVALAKDFIKNRYNDNVGLVIFGSFAFTASPLTYDLKSLIEIFDLTSNIGIAGTNTAIGEAIMQGVNTLSKGIAKSKVLILLTDGKHNSGEVSPREAVKEAIEKKVKIYTIGIGDDYDKELLSKIAKESGGRAFFAKDSSELKEIYKSIDRLEPSPIRDREYINREEMFIYPLILATLLLALLIYKEEL